VVCDGCGLYYTAPLPDTDATESGVAESDKYTQDQLAKEDFFRRRAARLLDDVESRRGKGALLDVGCAIGTELAVARERGWEAIGLELSKTSLAVARERGLDARGDTLEASTFPDGHFDLVTLNHVLEHIPEPSSFLHEIGRVLRRDGLLFVAVPNVHTWWFYLKGDRYGWTFQDDHFLHFTTGTLSDMLSRHGFEVLDCRTSRWIDYHEPPEARGALFRRLDAFAERRDLGIEVFCLARNRATR
jgi:SAM-dependent methyltransferase